MQSDQQLFEKNFVFWSQLQLKAIKKQSGRQVPASENHRDWVEWDVIHIVNFSAGAYTSSHVAFGNKTVKIGNVSCFNI